MSNRLIQYGFTAGIVSKTLWSQTVLQKYGYGLADCQNYIIEFSGALISRAGFLASRLMPMAIGKNYRLVPFVFAEEDANTYELLFVANKIYFLQQGAYQLESGKTVTKVEDGANYTQFTSNAHGYSVGDLIEFYGTGVPSYIQGQTVVVTAVTTNTFQCQQINKAADLDGWAAATATGVSAYRVYSLASPYGEDDLPNLYFNQARDVVEITSYDFDPKELERQSDGTWTLTNTVFELAISRPQNLVVTLEPSGGKYEELFAVSAVTDQGESLPSEPVRAYGADAQGGATLKWDAISDATKYIIYRSILAARDTAGRLTKAQALGFLGTSYAPLYFSYNQIPDFTKAPRRNINPFARAGLDYFTVTNGGSGYTVNDTAKVVDANGTGGEVVLVVDNNTGSVVGIVVLESGHGYTAPTVSITTSAGTGATFTIHLTPSSGNNPAISAIHQQRRIFASSNNNPMTLWGSNIGSFSTFTQSDIVADDDAYNYALATPILGQLYHIISTRVGMLAFANIGVWQITGSQGGAITPTDVQVDPITVVGSSKLPPLLVDSDVVYAETNNETIRLLQYNHFSRQYGGIDLSILAKDLFKGFFNLNTWSFENRPYRSVWASRNDGQMLSCTISQEQEVYAWGRHDTAGLIEQNITIPESDREVTYAVVRRYLAGRWVYVLEYFADRSRSTNENHCGVDCAVQFGGTHPAASLTFDGTSFVASSAIFTAADEGKIILHRSGKALITNYISTTEVEVTVINEFKELAIPYLDDLFKTIPTGDWTLAELVSSVRLPLNFRPATVTVYGDGKLYEDVEVAADGTVSFVEELAYGYIGFGFVCQAVTLPAAVASATIEMSRKNFKGIGLRYVDSKGIEVGTDPDDTYPIAKLMHPLLTEASLLQSRMEEVAIGSDWDEDTQVYIRSNGAFPTQVTGLVIDTEVGDDVD